MKLTIIRSDKPGEDVTHNFRGRMSLRAAFSNTVYSNFNYIGDGELYSNMDLELQLNGNGSLPSVTLNNTSLKVETHIDMNFTIGRAGKNGNVAGLNVVEQTLNLTCNNNSPMPVSVGSAESNANIVLQQDSKLWVSTLKVYEGSILTLQKDSAIYFDDEGKTYTIAHAKEEEVQIQEISHIDELIKMGKFIDKNTTEDGKFDIKWSEYNRELKYLNNFDEALVDEFLATNFGHAAGGYKAINSYFLKNYGVVQKIDNVGNFEALNLDIMGIIGSYLDGDSVILPS